MPKLDTLSVPKRKGVGYPAPFGAPCVGRIRQRLGDEGGIGDFGFNLSRLPPGNWSSQRHWHSTEDELVYILEGEVVLIEDDGETVLVAGDCATFPKNSENGHHLVNRSDNDVVYLEVGSRDPENVIYCSEVDMKSPNSDGRFLHYDGKPYPGQ